MNSEIKNTIKAEIVDLKANLNGQQERLSHLIEIIDKEEAGNTQEQEESGTEASSFDFKMDGIPRRDITREELKAYFDKKVELSHLKHPELEVHISKVESETNEPVTLTSSQIGKGIRYDNTISIHDETNRLIGDFKIEFGENGIKDISATYYKAFWSNH